MSDISNVRQGKMVGIIGQRFLITGRSIVCNHKFYVSTSSAHMIKWRFDQDVEPNPNRYGPLTNLPDYSFVDGRPVPLSNTAKKKLQLQEHYCETIMRLSAEIDFAVERHKNIEKNSKEKVQKLLESKLKPKGQALYKKKH